MQALHKRTFYFSNCYDRIFQKALKNMVVAVINPTIVRYFIVKYFMTAEKYGDGRDIIGQTIDIEIRKDPQLSGFIIGGQPSIYFPIGDHVNVSWCCSHTNASGVISTSHIVASHITKLLLSFRQILQFRF